MNKKFNEFYKRFGVIEYLDMMLLPIREGYLGYNSEINGTCGFVYAVDVERVLFGNQTCYLLKFDYIPESDDLETACDWENPVSIEEVGEYDVEGDRII